MSSPIYFPRSFYEGSHKFKNAGLITMLAGLFSFIGFSKVQLQEQHAAQCATGASPAPAAARNDYNVEKESNPVEQASSLTKKYLLSGF